MAEAQNLEQERRDQELAMRLAQDHATENGDTSLVLSDEARAQAATGQAKRKKAKAANYEFGNTKQAALHKKHDLSKWKYVGVCLLAALCHRARVESFQFILPPAVRNFVGAGCGRQRGS
jgi:hypothetical protein